MRIGRICRVCGLATRAHTRLMTDTNSIRTRCCIVGGGPAGMMLGLLLARAGVDTLVLEKHGDFLRDFRGDTVHPSTLQILEDLGLMPRFQELPQHRERELRMQIGDRSYPFGDFTGLMPFDYIAFVPQWDLLDLLADEARKHPNFRLLMNCQATQLLRDDGERVVGVSAQTEQASLRIKADLVVACDGRGSILRADAGLPTRDFGAPMDVLWFRMPREASDPPHSMGIVDRGRMLVLINRSDYWQCAYLIAKGGLDALKSQGLDAFRAGLSASATFMAARAATLVSWDQIKLLTVQVNRLDRWHLPGLLLIGDAAHAMSPVGGVGINLAIQDAVCAANRLTEALRGNAAIDESLLASVQQRRMWPTRLIQRIQLTIQRRVIAAALSAASTPKPPALLLFLLRFRCIRSLPARVFGLGFRRERPRLD